MGNGIVLRRVTLAVAALVAATWLTGCATRTTGSAVTTTASDCARTGVSASAASKTVRCYLYAIGTADYETACRMLAPQVRGDILRQGRDDGLDGAWRPGSGPPGVQCADVATIMRRAFDRLPGAELAQFRSAIRQARVDSAQVAGSGASVAVTVHYRGSSRTQSVELAGQGGQWTITSSHAFSVTG